MVITTIKKLNAKLAEWLETAIPGRRLANDTEGRKWFAKSIEYTDAFTLEALRQVTDREDLNDKYVERYLREGAQVKQGVSALKVEISALYSFNKCFVQRYKGRLHFYRDDLSQKGARTTVELGKTAAAHLEFAKNLS
jgi:hypothetical protein